MKSAIFSVSITLTFVGHVFAWGDVGHEAVGYVAMEFLATKAAAFVKNTVASTYDYSLGPCAPWADTFKYETGNTWSQALHFIDAMDDPLGGSCSVVESRDCGSAGCLSTAIANYTSRVTDSSLSATQIQQALYFITHYIGDIGQPLHVENYEYGGNDIDTVCAGKDTELHATWDTGMIVQMVSQTYSGSTTAWADALAAEIKTGSYQSDAAGWISCSSVTEPLSRKRSIEDDVKSVLEAREGARTVTPLACPMVWAQESNAYDCTNVFDYTKGDDLCTGAYFEASIPVINLQIAKQGYRLAAWLNVIFDGAVSLP